MTLSLRYNRLTVLGKGAEMVSPLPVPTLESAFHEFAYAVCELKIWNYLDRMNIDEDSSFGRISKSRKTKTQIASRWLHIPEILYAHIIE